jgi:glyoxylase-like metal-dependent hydrolase (beta-lactamase superfamily II)
MSDGLSFTIVPVTPFAQNCAVLRCEVTGKGAVLDPGGDVDRILEAAVDTDVEKILITHAHIDHAGATAALARRLAIPVEGPHIGDRFWVDHLPDQGRMFGVPGGERFEPSRWLEHGDTVQVGEQTLEVLHTPGHTPGHVVFFHRPSSQAFVGDVLFAGSIGRTDFPQGDAPALRSSIRERLFPLGDNVRFTCGHGPMSTFGDERRTNPFVGDGR